MYLCSLIYGSQLAKPTSHFAIAVTPSPRWSLVLFARYVHTNMTFLYDSRLSDKTDVISRSMTLQFKFIRLNSDGLFEYYSCLADDLAFLSNVTVISQSCWYRATRFRRPLQRLLYQLSIFIAPGSITFILMRI